MDILRYKSVAISATNLGTKSENLVFISYSVTSQKVSDLNSGTHKSQNVVCRRYFSCNVQ